MNSLKKLTPRERLKRIEEADKKRRQQKLSMVKSKENLNKLNLTEKNLLAIALLKLKDIDIKSLPQVTEEQIELKKISAGIPKEFQSERGLFYSLFYFFYRSSSIVSKKIACKKMERFIKLASKVGVNSTNFNLHYQKLKNELDRIIAIGSILSKAADSKDWIEKKGLLQIIKNEPLPDFLFENRKKVEESLVF
ncbi:MAG: hypothetical protein QG594_664 [Bacteroidota bacterium]|nr:hypothetical protein [Bacteroidota bacterium]